MDTSISTTLHHTIAYLLNPLYALFPSNTIDALHNALLSSFSSLSSLRTTATHKFLISPTAPAPPIIARALNVLPSHLRVDWADWCLLLSNGNQVVLSLTLAPMGLVTAAARNANTGLMDFTTIYDAKEVINARRRASLVWGPPIPAFASSSRSSAASSSASSSEHDLEFSSSSRSSSPDVVAVETAENVLSGIYDDEEDEDRMQYSRMASAFGGMSLLPRASPAPVQLQPNATTATMPQKSVLSAAAAEWFPRGGNLPSSATIQPQRFPTPPHFSLGGSPFAATPNTTVPSVPQQRVLPTPIGAHRVPVGGHSRSSSRSSTLTTPSLSSTVTSSAQSFVASPTSSPSSPTLSDTPSELYIDSSKDQQAVTEYECGKVGVLTGAVMLGVPKNSSNGSAGKVWRKRDQPTMVVQPGMVAPLRRV